MGSEHSTLPPPTGTPVVPPLVTTPPAPPTAAATAVDDPGSPLRLGTQDRGNGARVGSTASRLLVPMMPVARHRHSSGWLKVALSWVLVGAVVIVAVKLYPDVKERLTLDDSRVTAAPDGFQIDDGVVSFRVPARPRKILVHLAGQSEGLTGFRMTIDSGTLDVDVKNTDGTRTPAALQRFCDVQFEHNNSTLGPAITDSSSFDHGIYRRSASWHEGEKFVLATCLGHAHSNVYIEAKTLHERWAPYAQAVATTDFGT